MWAFNNLQGHNEITELEVTRNIVSSLQLKQRVYFSEMRHEESTKMGYIFTCFYYTQVYMFLTFYYTQAYKQRVEVLLIIRDVLDIILKISQTDLLLPPVSVPVVELGTSSKRPHTWR